MAANLGRDAWMISLVYNIDRMANLEVTVKNGTADRIRTMDEILVYVARFFDNHTVALGPVVSGQSSDQNLKAQKEGARPLYEAYRILGGLSDRLSEWA